LPSTGNVLKKLLLEIVKRHNGDRNLLNASQFGFCARHNTTMQCMRLADHVLLSLLAHFFRKKKIRVSVEDEMSMSRYMQAGVPQGSVLFTPLYKLYINDTPQTYGVNLALFADDTCLYATDPKESYVLGKIQRGLNSMAAWWERWNIKINEDKTGVIYFTHRNRPPDFLLTLNGRNIPFVNSVKYLGVIFVKRMTWRLHTEMIEAKAFRISIRIYSLFISKRLTDIKLTLHKALIGSVMT
jgi:hypothetical protein